MIELTLNKDGELEGYSSAPAQHSMTKIAKKSGNYGLDAEYRKKYPEMVLPEGVDPTEEVVRTMRLNNIARTMGRGRGRGRGGKVKLEEDTLSLQQKMEVDALLQTGMGGMRLNEDQDVYEEGACAGAAAAVTSKESYEIVKTGVDDDCNNER